MLQDIAKTLAEVLLAGFVFSAIERWRPAAPSQSAWRADLVTDILYAVLPVFLYAPLAPRAFFAGAGFVFGGRTFGVPAVMSQPLWAQAAEALVLMDFLGYLGHRLLHRGSLWSFHAIHHGAIEIDWLTAARNHPVNVVVQRIIVTAPLVLFGFSPLAICAAGPVFAFWGFLTHANLDTDFGPLRYLLVSPALHRWHHTGLDEGGNKNFGDVFALWDVIFGTFYLPETKATRFGLEDGPPADLIGQTLWPL